MHDALPRRNFHLLLGGQFISDFGGQLTVFALPAIAILILHASAMQVAALQSAELAVIPLLALPVGFVVDRVRRKPFMLRANAVRLGAIALLPAIACSGHLSIAWLFLAAVGAAIGSLCFDTAYQPFLRRMLGPVHYAGGNAKMATGAALAQAAGNAVAGPLVQCAGAAFALAGNIVTYVAGSIALFRIDIPEEQPQHPEGEPIIHEALEGMRLTFGDRVLRNIALSSAVVYFGCAMVNAVLAMYVYRSLHVSAGAYGIIVGLSNVGIAGGLMARRVAERLGPRVALAAAIATMAAGQLLYTGAAVPIAGIIIGRIVVSFASPLFDVVQQTVVTFRVPEQAFGRTCAAMRAVTWSAFPAGALAGGILAEHFGFQTTIAAGALLCGVALVPLFWRSHAGRTWSACWPSPTLNFAQHSPA
jgi:MFS family permease